MSRKNSLVACHLSQASEPSLKTVAVDEIYWYSVFLMSYDDPMKWSGTTETITSVLPCDNIMSFKSV